jgi:hypothetical protein
MYGFSFFEKNSQSLLRPPDFACRRGLLPVLPLFREIKKFDDSENPV